MDQQLIILRPPIPRSDYQQIEAVVRGTGVVTCFDSSVDPASAVRFVSEKARFRTETRALIDLNVFRDILSLGRPDDGRDAAHQRLAAALAIFFQTAGILVEPCMALHESPSDAALELELFYRIDNANPRELLEVFHGKRTSVTLPDLSEPISIDQAVLKRPLHGTTLLEIALLKLATLLRENMTNFERIEHFLIWCYDDFLFMQEPVILAIHQLAGNRPKPLLRGFNKIDPKERLEGVRNALWDCLLIREWTRKLERQATKGEIWLLASRDDTLRDYARKLVIADRGVEDVAQVLDSTIAGIWPRHHAKRISELYHRLTSNIEDPLRRFNHSGRNLDLESLKDQLQGRLIS